MDCCASPENALRPAFVEMVRVTRGRGRSASDHQDGDTWVIDHLHRELTHRIVRFNSDQRYSDGWTGRRLRRSFREVGLREVDVRIWIHVDTTAGSYLYGMPERLAGAAVAAGTIEPGKESRWLGQLRDLAAARNFFSTMNYCDCSGFRV
jgi:hypothetical protein